MQVTLVVESGPQVGSSFAVEPGEAKVLGSGAAAHIRLAGDGVRDQHAAALVDASGLQVVDLCGGTHLNGRPLPLRSPTPAGPDDELRLGEVCLRVEVSGAAPELVRAARARREAALLPPDEFEVVRELGRGGMGVVLHARRLSDGRPVAVKVLHERVTPGSPEHRRFVTEARTGARVRSPHVVAVLDARLGGDRPLIVMELVEGPSAQRLMHEGRLGPLDALRIAEHVARALGAAASVGVVHRDVKPENVLLHPAGVAKLTDFGIAKDLESTVRSLTMSGVGLGTLAYMAPEAASDAKAVGPAADLYSLGATLYHFLGGRPPFDVRSPEDLRRVLEEAPVPLPALRPDCPLDLAELVHALLQKEPWDRPRSAAEVAGALAALRERYFPGAPA